MELFGTEYLISTYFWTTVSFLFLLAIIVWKFLPAINAVLDERAERVRNDLAHAESQREAAERTLAEYQKQLADAKTEAAGVISKARDEAAAMMATKTKELEAELAKKAEDASKSIAETRAAALRDIQGEVAKLTLIATEKLLGTAVDAKKAESITRDAIKDLVN